MACHVKYSTIVVVKATSGFVSVVVNPSEADVFRVAIETDDPRVSADGMARLTRIIVQHWSTANNLSPSGVVASGRDSWRGR